MNLTQLQLTTFKTWLDANAAALPDQFAADLANQKANPNYLVWKTVATHTDVHAAAGFDWTRVDNLSVGKARIWEWMVNLFEVFNPWQGNIRMGINAVWVGTAGDLAVRDAVNGACQRTVTNFEKLYVRQTTDGPPQTGNRGSFTNADLLGLDADGVFLEGQVTDILVRQARDSG